jgi:aspartate/methionine/tyrosine aminotransferase
MKILHFGFHTTASSVVIEKLAAYKHYLSICNSAPSEILALIALRAAPRILDKIGNICDSNLKEIESFLSRFSQVFDWIRPRGGTIGFMRIKFDGHDSISLAEKLVTQKSVLILPGSFFPGKTIDTSNHFRIGFGKKDFSVALNALADAMEELFPDLLIKT